MSSLAAPPVVVGGTFGETSNVAVGSDMMEITPLGSGCEVGRSCIVVKFKGSTVMFDCGAHPAYTGHAALPYFDEIDPSEIDLLLVTHFHMDHCGAVPYFTEKTGFAGRVFMTHPTKAVYKILLHDAVKIGHGEMERMWDERDMLSSMEKIELINYHQVLHHKGIRFWCYNAGHVLGACMFMVEIAGVRVLYTGDYSRQPDRHLLGAETPSESPHVLIVESTYGTKVARRPRHPHTARAHCLAPPSPPPPDRLGPRRSCTSRARCASRSSRAPSTP
jgi:cleavage and polyadenylation specificity factor subunit 3